MSAAAVLAALSANARKRRRAVTTQYLDEFQHEFEQEQAGRLSRRVFWYCLVSFCFAAVVLAVVLLGFRPSSLDLGEHWRSLAVWVLSASAMFFTAFYAASEARDARNRQRTRDARLARVSTFIAITNIVGAVNIFAAGVLSGGFSVGVLAFLQVAMIFYSHCTACLFLPWSWQESLRPFMPMYLINAVGMAALWIIRGDVFGFFGVFFIIFYALVSICAVLPGIGIAYWRHNRFAQEFTFKAVAGRYGEMRRELSGAQRIHEALFPRPETRGQVRFDYRYQPMNSIGGDYLYARFIATDDRAAPQLLCLLLDVTGHGIPAALTVNRLYGEIERLLAEDPTIAPTALLRALNRYCYLTLSDHSLFVTACAFRLDPDRGLLHYANAGHPPAFVRSKGVVLPLDPTAMVLGVALDLDVEAEGPTVPFHPGDALIAYTDGAIETRDRHGRMFNVDGIRDVLVGRMGGDHSPLCHDVIAAVAAHRHGPLSDDTLVVEIARLSAQGHPAVTVTAHHNGHHTPQAAAAQPANTSGA